MSENLDAVLPLHLVRDEVEAEDSCTQNPANTRLMITHNLKPSSARKAREAAEEHQEKDLDERETPSALTGNPCSATTAFEAKAIEARALASNAS